MFKKILYSVAFVLMLMSLSACSSSPSDTPQSVSADAADQSSKQSSIVSEPDTNAQTLDTDDSTGLENPSDTVESPVDTEPTDTTISLESLWSKIAGVWYDPQTEYLEFFVVGYDEENQPVIYNVWGFDRDENVLAAGISNIGDNRYEVTFENGTMKLLFDCSSNGRLTVTTSDNSDSWVYDFLASTLDEAYNIMGVYENAGGEEGTEPSVQLPDEAIEKINENLRLIGFGADMYMYFKISSIYYEYGDYNNGLYYAEQCFNAKRPTDGTTEPYQFAIDILNLAGHYNVPANEFEQLKALAMKHFGQNQDFMFMLAQVS